MMYNVFTQEAINIYHIFINTGYTIVETTVKLANEYNKNNGKEENKE